MFYIGQEVVCVISHRLSKVPLNTPPLIKGKTYIIQNLSTCPHCDKLALDVGLDSTTPTTRCSECNKSYENNGTAWLNHKRFVPVDYTQAKKVEFNKIVEEIPILSN